MFSQEETRQDHWYMGLDIGTVGISAVLQNLTTGQKYPLFWLSRLPNSTTQTVHCLPLMAYFNPRLKATGKPTLSMVVGAMATQMKQEGGGTFVEQFKPLLNLLMPYYSRKQRQWEPKVYGEQQQVISLYWIQRALQTLLSTLNSEGTKTSYRVRAENLSGQVLRQVLGRLEGVMVNCPATWGDTYRFNVREAILGAKLVQVPDRVVFVEDAIAVLLMNQSTIRVDRQQIKQEKVADPRPYVAPPDAPSTLILQGGMSTLELALVDLPDDFSGLSYSDFSLTSLEYGFNALYQDIFYQLIDPQWRSQQAFLAELTYETPQPGEPDQPKRNQAFLNLLAFAEGRSLLETARRVFLILEKQDSFTTLLGEQTWGVQRQDLIEQILAPFTKQLNQQINVLLSHKGYQGDAIAQVLYSGDFFHRLFPFLQPWLTQKFPQARFLPGVHPPNTSVVASGLATLPQFPQLFDRLRHQYSDYFLLSELLHTFPQKPITLERMLRALEQRGINPKACMWRILALLEGKLPSGLVPTVESLPWLSPDSQQTVEYQAVMAAPLFRPDGQGQYQPNYQQGRRLRQYLSLVFAGTQQKLEDPLSIFMDDSFIKGGG